MHLLWLTEHYYPGHGGMAQSCDRIVHGLRRLGARVDVIHCTRRAHAVRVEAKTGGRLIVHPLGDDPAHGLNNLWNFLSADQDRASFTHVVAFGGIIPLLAGPLFSSWLGLPLVTLFRGNDFDIGILSPKRSELVHEAIRRSARVCTVSREKAEKIERLYPGSDPVWVSNGIDLDEWKPLPSDLDHARAWRTTNVPQGRRVLGIFGQIKRKKGALFLLEALLDSGAIDRFHLLFVGQVGHEVCELLGLHDDEFSYSIEPFLDRYELLGYYPACDLVAIPSFYDGTPNVMLEAAALGIPLLASTAGGMGDLLVDAHHGYLFHPGDIDGCRAALRRAADASDEELGSLGRNCRQLVGEKCDVEREAEAYRRVMNEAADERGTSHRPEFDRSTSHEMGR